MNYRGKNGFYYRLDAKTGRRGELLQYRDRGHYGSGYYFLEGTDAYADTCRDGLHHKLMIELSPIEQLAAKLLGEIPS